MVTYQKGRMMKWDRGKQERFEQPLLKPQNNKYGVKATVNNGDQSEDAKQSTWQQRTGLGRCVGHNQRRKDQRVTRDREVRLEEVIIDWLTMFLKWVRQKGKSFLLL
jgi:hypothetical protein